jgi:acetyltransferase-like isoleucine patch superfamily enzyme
MPGIAMNTDPTVTRETLIDTLSETAGSPFRKYQELCVGSRSVTKLLKYEFVVVFLSPMPGALGLFLRKAFYRSLFAEYGRGTAIGPYVTLRSPGQISLGNNNFLDSHAVLDAKGPASHIRLGDSVLVGANTVISCASAEVSVGNDVSIGPHCHLRAGMSPVTLGACLTIGSHSVIISGNPSYERLDIPMKRQVGSTEGIVVGDDVWMGVGVRIIDGVTIGRGSVVGAGAVVIKDVPEYSIVAGVPAKVIGTRK